VRTDEGALSYNNGESPYMFRDAMLKLLLAETLPYSQLIKDQFLLGDFTVVVPH
jgi:hypothetical protein